MEHFGGGFLTFIFLFLIIAAILAILLPFFVLKIRNEIVSMNKKMAKIIEILSYKNNPSEKFAALKNTADLVDHSSFSTENFKK